MHALVWDVSPTLVHLGPLELRYYGILFASTLLFGFYFFKMQMRRYGYKDEIADDFLIWGVLGTVIGARLIHCFFYEPSFYLSNPLEILKVWKGGIASHGATVGLITVVWVFTSRRKIPFLKLSDGIVMAAALGSSFVRFGNFMNSEIVGRLTTDGWGIKFLRYSPDKFSAFKSAAGACVRDDMQCLTQYWPVRYPSQLYEAIGGMIILIALLVAFHLQKKKQYPGLIVGIFLSSYFSFRFFIEYVKEFQTLHSGFTMGQYLSIPFFIFGVTVMFISLKTEPIPELPDPNIEEKPSKEPKKKSKKHKRKK
ncbi:prolipoprotein diacylglyceryl transferase [bacterium]|nr:prolipoprotein diacylglyceryl transferase [bacterium]